MGRNWKINIQQFVCSRHLIPNQSVQSEPNQDPQILSRTRRADMSRERRNQWFRPLAIAAVFHHISMSYFYYDPRR